jgi:hypothetical protein
METILQHAQGLVYSLLCLMPSTYQKASLNALLGLFLDAQGHALPAHTAVKSPSSLSRFLNRYTWSTRRVIRTVNSGNYDSPDSGNSGRRNHLRDDRIQPEERVCDPQDELRCTGTWSAIWFRNYAKQSCPLQT